MGTPVRHPGTHRTRGCGHGWTGGSSSGGRGPRTCRNPGCSRADEVTSIEAAVSRPIFSIAIGSSMCTVAALTTPAVCAGMDGVDPGRQRSPRAAVRHPPGASIRPRCCDLAATRRRRVVGHGRTPSSLLTLRVRYPLQRFPPVPATRSARPRSPFRWSERLRQRDRFPTLDTSPPRFGDPNAQSASSQERVADGACARRVS